MSRKQDEDLFGGDGVMGYLKMALTVVSITVMGAVIATLALIRSHGRKKADSNEDPTIQP